MYVLCCVLIYKWASVELLNLFMFEYNNRCTAIKFMERKVCKNSNRNL